jgi:MFS family permease
VSDHTDQEAERKGPKLHGWRDPPIIAVTLVVAAAGFGQFGAAAALADVAADFGAVVNGDEDPTIAEQAGLSGTKLGIGLAIIRLASLGSLPLAGLADRLGRRATVIGLGCLGLALVAAASLSPSYWWFVAIFALSRPMLTATDAVGEVSAAEETASADRAKAIALVAAGYGVGSGLVAVTRGIGGDALGWRPLFGLALVALVLVVIAGRHVQEPDRYSAARAREDKPLPVLGAVGPRFRRKVVILAALVFAIAVVTGPANTFMFVYAEGILGLSPAVTAGLVVGAGLTGLVGLLIGRWGADRIGRRLTGGAALVGVAAAGIITYSGTTVGLGIGYLCAVLAGSAFAPATGALHAELFPTSVRATVAGWLIAAGVLGAVVGLLAFGAVADAADRFSLAALVVFVPAAVASILFVLVPETMGQELEAAEAD